jgi:hypothetical protein
MFGAMEMLCGVLIFGRVATPDVPAAETKTQVHPTVSHLQAFFAALGLGLYWTNLIEVRTFIGHMVSSTAIT